MTFHWSYGLPNRRATKIDALGRSRNFSQNPFLEEPHITGKLMSLVDYKLIATEVAPEYVPGGAEIKKRRGRRAFDIFAAFTGILLCAIAIPILLILNPMFNPGPLFFRQDRMGRNGQKFSLLKFRSMQPSLGATGKRSHCDPVEAERITALGQIIRRLRIDELPNFWNVLRGEMSLIGPRPDAWEHAEEYSKSVPYYRNRFCVSPGITGLAQVRGGYAIVLEPFIGRLVLTTTMLPITHLNWTFTSCGELLSSYVLVLAQSSHKNPSV